MRRTLILAALAGLLLAPAAHAHGIATLVVSGATYEPGAEVTVNGQFVDPEIAALSAPATVTLGIDGPILGQALIAADGMWDLTFVLPQAVAVGTYVLQASVVGTDGGLVTPLLARAGLVVTSPVPGSSAQPPVEDGSNETGGLPADTATGDAGYAAPVVVPAATTPVAPAATVRRPVAVPAGAVAPRPVLHTPARPAAQRRPPARATPPVRAVVRPAARNVKPSSRPRRTAPVVAAPARPPASAATRQARPVVTVSPRLRAQQGGRRSSTSSPVPRPNPLQPLLLGVGALLLLLAAAGTFAFLEIRRRRRLAAIELELQQLLAEENARRDSPVTVSA